MQSVAPPGAVLVDDVTRQVTSAAVEFEAAGEHELKGKAEPLRLWRATRIVGGVRGSQREQGLDAPFVGRDGDALGAVPALSRVQRILGSSADAVVT